jgi:hypothetical protein
MIASVKEILDIIDQEKESTDQLSQASQDILITKIIEALEERIPLEPTGYFALRELCGRGGVPIELLLLAHSLAQWVFCATIDELDGSFLDRAVELEPNNLKVLYAVLAKQPNIEGNPDQRAFEHKIVDKILQLEPGDRAALTAKVILDNSHESLPLDFINDLPNPLEGVDLSQLLKELNNKLL